MVNLVKQPVQKAPDLSISPFTVVLFEKFALTGDLPSLISPRSWLRHFENKNIFLIERRETPTGCHFADRFGVKSQPLIQYILIKPGIRPMFSKIYNFVIGPVNFWCVFLYIYASNNKYIKELKNLTFFWCKESGNISNSHFTLLL